MADPAETKVTNILARLIDVGNPAGGPSQIYRAVRDDMEMLARIWMILPGSGNPLANEDPTIALADLIAFKTISGLDDITEAANKVTGAFNSYFGAEIRAFADLVGEDTITATNYTKVFETRRLEEVAEQNANLTQATEFQRKLVQAATPLGIGLTSTSTASPKPSKKSGGFNPLGFLYVPIKPKPGSKEIDHTTTYDWQTPAVFDPKSEDATLFERIYGFLFVKKLDPAVVQQSLETTYGYNRAAIEALFVRLYAQTNAQIEQSQKILTYIEKDYKMYQDCMMAGLEFQAMIVDIGKFFGFQVGKTSPKKSTK